MTRVGRILAPEERWLVPVLIGPALAFILVGSLVPIAATAWEALHGHDLRLPWLGRPFIGLGNFVEAAGDHQGVREAEPRDDLLAHRT